MTSHKLNTVKRLLIVGDAGRGKTTFAHVASERLRIPVTSLDDILWRKKYKEVEDDSVAIARIKEIFSKDEWIVEGNARHLARLGFDHAQTIYYFCHKSFPAQLVYLIRRYAKKRNCTVIELINLLVHAFYKRYGWGYERGQKSWDEILHSYGEKVIRVQSAKDLEKLKQEFL